MFLLFLSFFDKFMMIIEKNCFIKYIRLNMETETKRDQKFIMYLSFCHQCYDKFELSKRIPPAKKLNIYEKSSSSLNIHKLLFYLLRFKWECMMLNTIPKIKNYPFPFSTFFIIYGGCSLYRRYTCFLINSGIFI